MLTATAQGWDAVAEKATLPEDVRRKVVNALELVVADNQQIIELRATVAARIKRIRWDAALTEAAPGEAPAASPASAPASAPALPAAPSAREAAVAAAEAAGIEARRAIAHFRESYARAQEAQAGLLNPSDDDLYEH